MAILIKGMEMPKEGSWTTVRIYPDGTCAVPNWQGDCTLIKGTKAVPVPPHGRLIDADAEIARVQNLYNKAVAKDPEMGCVSVYEGEIAVLKLAPTIVPAEEE